VRRLFWPLALAFSTEVQLARADFDIVRVSEALRRADARKTVLPRALANAAHDRVSVLLERTNSLAKVPPGARRLDGDWFALTLPRERAAELAPTEGFVSHWAPARHLLLDRALAWCRVPEFRARFETSVESSGKGVVVGLVDTGLALDHPDFLDENGRTRVRWLIDFTRPPAHMPGGAALEDALGCAGERPCAVYSTSDLESVLHNDIDGDEPRDGIGHGTHVASLAASNGRSLPTRLYAGVAPDADLVVARVTDGQTGITDPVILEAVRFVFERAQELGEPAVVNLSLGSDLGAHDGSSALERALTSFIGADHPGRAIVVAAGNSGGLFRGVRLDYPAPFGIHTEVQVPRESPTKVAVLTPKLDAATTNGRITLWLTSRPGDALSIGVERGGRRLGPVVEQGSAAQLNRGDPDVIVLNGTGATGTQPLAKNSAIVLIDGSWTSGETFDLVLEGHGTASLWLEGTGDVDPSQSLGPLFPLAQKEGTVNVPATAPELIAVGATFNRGDWVDAEGIEVLRPSNGALADSPADTISYFSSAGPNALGGMKPDIVAPGANVIGAMASDADPRQNPGSLFAGDGICGSIGECLVVDDLHAVASGTSMAAPLVSGVVALLLQQDPSLNQLELRALLQAGARRLEGAESFEPQVGPGAVDAAGSLEALRIDHAQARLPGSASWLSLAAAYARPDPNWSLEGYAEVRDDEGRLADGFEPARLSMRVRGAMLSEPLERIAPGLYGFAVAAPYETGGATLEASLLFDGAVLAQRTLPIAVDRGALTGLAVARGGCGYAAANAPSGFAAVLIAISALLPVRRRRPLKRAS
jgi:subtilisin family serine protease